MTSAETAAPATFQISVQPSGRVFSANPGEAILAAAIRSGVGLPYGCKDGACGSCKCKKLSGTVHHGEHQSKALSADEEAAGLVLTCCSNRARSRKKARSPSKSCPCVWPRWRKNRPT